MDLVEEVLKGNKRAASRLMTMVENEEEGTEESLRGIYAHTGKAHVVGVLGSTGAGKSTLIYALTKELRKRGKKVGVVAIDPSSPHSGGALLGDRIRMRGLSTDEGIFIRSMGTRGHLGGISGHTDSVVSILDAMGMDLIFIETAGSGQSEVEIENLAHTLILVEVPGLGDDIQAMKAGILEIGDIFVLNKADKEGVDSALAGLNLTIDFEREKEWTPPIVLTVATEEKGVDVLADKVEEHFSYLRKTSKLKEKEEARIRVELERMLESRLLSMLMDKVDDVYEEVVEDVTSRKLDPRTAAKKLIELGFGKTQESVPRGDYSLS